MYEGEMTVATIQAIPYPTLFKPSFNKPAPIVVGDDAAVLSSGLLTICHAVDKWDAYVIENNRVPIACAHDEPLFGCMVNGKTEIINLAKDAVTTISQTASSMTATAIFKDSGGAEWTAVRTFIAAHNNAVNVTTSIRVTEDRQIVQMPWITLFPGLGSFGEHKTQALLAGVEYLVDEPSSDTKDFAPQKADRRIVNDYKLCFPLMAISHKKKWLSLSWDYDKFPATIFDSPDHQFHSGGHLFALWSPGPQQKRTENEFDIHEAFPIYKNVPLKLEATIAVGDNDGTVVSAIADYVERNPLPPLPVYEDGFQGALSLMAHGWLDSVVREGNKWRHAHTKSDHHCDAIHVRLYRLHRNEDDRNRSNHDEDNVHRYRSASSQPPTTMGDRNNLLRRKPHTASREVYISDPHYDESNSQKKHRHMYLRSEDNRDSPRMQPHTAPRQD